MTTGWDWKEWDDQYSEHGHSYLYKEAVTSISRQLVQCFHPDCLCLAEVILEAQWTEVEWESLEVCVAHIPWGNEVLMHHEAHEGVPALLAVQLHPFPES